MSTPTITPLTGHIGALVSGVDLAAPMPEPVVDAIRAALHVVVLSRRKLVEALLREFPSLNPWDLAA